MSNTKPFDPERPDKDNPDWTRADMERARPASEMLPGLIGANATDELLRRGKGWQTHINEVLRQTMPKHEK
jgi:uncharacterized protein (DUF4415 family)